jgi:hypothetical protein
LHLLHSHMCSILHAALTPAGSYGCPLGSLLRGGSTHKQAPVRKNAIMQLTTSQNRHHMWPRSIKVHEKLKTGKTVTVPRPSGPQSIANIKLEQKKKSAAACRAYQSCTASGSQCSSCWERVLRLTAYKTRKLRNDRCSIFFQATA